MFKLYLVTNLLNYKRYAGITSQRIEDRFTQHCTQGRFLTNAIKKYGRKNFTVELVATSDDVDMIKKYEIEYIRKLNLTSKEFGYNLSDGGDLATKTESTRRKISEALRGRELSPEHLAKIKANAVKNGLKRKGKPRPAFTEEWKANMSKSRKGIPLSEEHRKAIKEALNSSEKFKNADKGKYFRMSNPQHDPKIRAKIARSKFKPIYCVNNGLCYPSLKYAAEDLGLKVNSMSTALTRGNKLHGYKFYYIYT